MGRLERAKRYLILFAGIFFIALGVALFTKSGTGTSAISVIPYSISLILPQLSYGTWVALFNYLLVFLQLALLRRAMPVREIVQQIIFASVFGSVVDVAMFLLTYFNPSAYWMQVITAVASCFVLAFGAYLTLICRVGVMAGDGFARALATVTGRSFATMRVASDTTMAVIAAVMSIAAFGTLITVREGTVIAALFTGTIVGFYTRRLKRFEHWLLPLNAEIDAAEDEGFAVIRDKEVGTR